MPVMSPDSTQSPDARPVVTSLPSGVEPALQVLIACARAHLGDSTKVDGLFRATEVEEDRLLRLAQRHGLSTQLLRWVQSEEAALMTEGARRALAQRAQENAEHALMLVHELTALLNLFGAQGIPVRVWKGPVLAYDLYGETGRRTFGDLDLLVTDRHLLEADRLLRERGYECPLSRDEIRHLRPYWNAFVYAHPEDTRVVDLHTKLQRRATCAQYKTSALWQARRMVDVAGRAVPTFPEEETFVLLCLHGTRHLWRRLGWIVDCAAWIKRQDATDWARVGRLAEKWSCQRAVDLAGRVVQQFTGVAPPTEVAGAAPANDRLVSRVCDHLDRDRLMPGRYREHALRLRMIPSWIGRLRYLGSHLCRPAKSEVRAAGLPPSLLPLWPVIRPVGLLFRHGKRLAGILGASIKRLLVPTERSL